MNTDCRKVFGAQFGGLNGANQFIRINRNTRAGEQDKPLRSENFQSNDSRQERLIKKKVKDLLPSLFADAGFHRPPFEQSDHRDSVERK